MNGIEIKKNTVKLLKHKTKNRTTNGKFKKTNKIMKSKNRKKNLIGGDLNSNLTDDLQNKIKKTGLKNIGNSCYMNSFLQTVRILNDDDDIGDYGYNDKSDYCNKFVALTKEIIKKLNNYTALDKNKLVEYRRYIFFNGIIPYNKHDTIDSQQDSDELFKNYINCIQCTETLPKLTYNVSLVDGPVEFTLDEYKKLHNIKDKLENENDDTFNNRINNQYNKAIQKIKDDFGSSASLSYDDKGDGTYYTYKTNDKKTIPIDYLPSCYLSNFRSDDLREAFDNIEPKKTYKTYVDGYTVASFTIQQDSTTNKNKVMIQSIELILDDSSITDEIKEKLVNKDKIKIIIIEPSRNHNQLKTDGVNIDACIMKYGNAKGGHYWVYIDAHKIDKNIPEGKNTIEFNDDNVTFHEKSVFNLAKEKINTDKNNHMRVLVISQVLMSCRKYINIVLKDYDGKSLKIETENKLKALNNGNDISDIKMDLSDAYKNKKDDDDYIQKLEEFFYGKNVKLYEQTDKDDKEFEEIKEYNKYFDIILTKLYDGANKKFIVQNSIINKNDPLFFIIDGHLFNDNVNGKKTKKKISSAYKQLKATDTYNVKKKIVNDCQHKVDKIVFGEGGKQSVQNSTESCNIIDMYHKKEIYRDYLELYNIYIKNHADKSTQSDMNKIDSTVTEEILPRNFFTILFNFSRFVNFSVKSNFIPQKTISTFKPFYNKFYDKQYLFKPGAGSDNERYTKFKKILDEIRQIDNKFPVIHNDDLFKGDSFVDIKDFIKLLFDKNYIPRIGLDTSKLNTPATTPTSAPATAPTTAPTDSLFDDDELSNILYTIRFNNKNYDNLSDKIKKNIEQEKYIKIKDKINALNVFTQNIDNLRTIISDVLSPGTTTTPAPATTSKPEVKIGKFEDWNKELLKDRNYECIKSKDNEIVGLFFFDRYQEAENELKKKRDQLDKSYLDTNEICTKFLISTNKCPRNITKIKDDEYTKNMLRDVFNSYINDDKVHNINKPFVKNYYNNWHKQLKGELDYKSEDIPEEISGQMFEQLQGKFFIEYGIVKTCITNEMRNDEFIEGISLYFTNEFTRQIEYNREHIVNIITNSPLVLFKLFTDKIPNDATSIEYLFDSNKSMADVYYPEVSLNNIYNSNMANKSYTELFDINKIVDSFKNVISNNKHNNNKLYELSGINDVFNHNDINDELNTINKLYETISIMSRDLNDNSLFKGLTGVYNTISGEMGNLLNGIKAKSGYNNNQLDRVLNKIKTDTGKDLKFTNDMEGKTKSDEIKKMYNNYKNELETTNNDKTIEEVITSINNNKTKSKNEYKHFGEHFREKNYLHIFETKYESIHNLINYNDNNSNIANSITSDKIKDKRKRIETEKNKLLKQFGIYSETEIKIHDKYIDTMLSNIDKNSELMIIIPVLNIMNDNVDINNTSNIYLDTINNIEKLNIPIDNVNENNDIDKINWANLNKGIYNMDEETVLTIGKIPCIVLKISLSMLYIKGKRTKFGKEYSRMPFLRLIDITSENKYDGVVKKNVRGELNALIKLLLNSKQNIIHNSYIEQNALEFNELINYYEARNNNINKLLEFTENEKIITEKINIDKKINNLLPSNINKKNTTMNTRLINSQLLNDISNSDIGTGTNSDDSDEYKNTIKQIGTITDNLKKHKNKNDNQIKKLRSWINFWKEIKE